MTPSIMDVGVAAAGRRVSPIAARARHAGRERGQLRERRGRQSADSCTDSVSTVNERSPSWPGPAALALDLDGLARPPTSMTRVPTDTRSPGSPARPCAQRRNEGIATSIVYVSGVTLTNTKSPVAFVTTGVGSVVLRFADQRDRRAGNHAALRVLDRAGHRSRRHLRERSSRPAKCQGCDQIDRSHQAFRVMHLSSLYPLGTPPN